MTLNYPEILRDYIDKLEMMDENKYDDEEEMMVNIQEIWMTSHIDDIDRRILEDIYTVKRMRKLNKIRSRIWKNTGT